MPFLLVREYRKVPVMAMADPIILFLPSPSLKRMAETTIMITRLAVLRTEEVTAPTWAVKPNANSL